MRVRSNYQPHGKEPMPKKSGSKSFVTKDYAKSIKKRERLNRKAGRK